MRGEIVVVVVVTPAITIHMCTSYPITHSVAGKTPLELLVHKLGQPGLTDAQRGEMEEVRGEGWRDVYYIHIHVCVCRLLCVCNDDGISLTPFLPHIHTHDQTTKQVKALLEASVAPKDGEEDPEKRAKREKREAERQRQKEAKRRQR